MVRFSHNGRQVVTASRDGTARVWDARNGKPVTESLRHEAQANSAEFSPDDSRVLTCSWDGTAKIWPVVAAPVPVPPWLPDLAEAVAGERMNEQNLSQPVSVEVLYRLRQQLTASAGTGYYERWVKWFFADSASRAMWPQ